MIIQNCVICFGNLEINSNSHKGYTYNNQLYILNSALIFLDSSIFTYICNFLWPINEFISYFIISAYILKKMYRYIHLSPSLTQLGKFVILFDVLFHRKYKVPLKHFWTKILHFYHQKCTSHGKYLKISPIYCILYYLVKSIDLATKPTSDL